MRKERLKKTDRGTPEQAERLKVFVAEEVLKIVKEMDKRIGGVKKIAIGVKIWERPQYSGIELLDELNQQIDWASWEIARKDDFWQYFDFDQSGEYIPEENYGREKLQRIARALLYIHPDVVTLANRVRVEVVRRPMSPHDLHQQAVGKTQPIGDMHNYFVFRGKERRDLFPMPTRRDDLLQHGYHEHYWPTVKLSD